jgi:hypothetical protein
VSGGVPERLAVIPGALMGVPSLLSLDDGRVVLPSLLSGRRVLLAARAGHDPLPLLETPTWNSTPAAQLSQDEIAFLAEPPPTQVIAVGSLASGRIRRTLEGSRGMSIEGLTVSRDRRTLFFASQGAVWSIPSADGSPKKIYRGDAVAVDPRLDQLIVELFEPEGARLARVDPVTGIAQPIEFTGDSHLAILPMTGAAVDRNGRILVQVTERDLWFWRPGLINPALHRLERIAVDYQGDILTPAWTADGRVVSIGQSLAAKLWRFRPQDALPTP